MEDAYEPYSDNTVNAASAGFIYTKGSATGCHKMYGFKAFGCSIGQISSFVGTPKLIMENVIVADCRRAVTLRIGGI